MRCLTFASIKGGVGKTTLSVHVAAALADKGKKTLILDLDPQGHASVMAGVELEAQARCLGDALVPYARTKMPDVVHDTERDTLRVGPSNARMIALERDLFRWGHRLSSIPRALEALEDPPDVIVLDTPPQINAYTEAALAVSDLVVVPVPAMAHALQGLDEIFAAWQDVSDMAGGEMVIAVNMWDRRTKATNAAMDQALSELELPVDVLRQRVLRAEVLNQAGLNLELIFDYAPRAEVSQGLRSLADELWRRSGRVMRRKQNKV
jgi:chromosome partitioning protein